MIYSKLLNQKYNFLDFVFLFAVSWNHQIVRKQIENWKEKKKLSFLLKFIIFIYTISISNISFYKAFASDSNLFVPNITKIIKASREKSHSDSNMLHLFLIIMMTINCFVKWLNHECALNFTSCPEHCYGKLTWAVCQPSREPNWLIIVYWHLPLFYPRPLPTPVPQKSEPLSPVEISRSQVLKVLGANFLAWFSSLAKIWLEWEW